MVCCGCLPIQSRQIEDVCVPSMAMLCSLLNRRMSAFDGFVFCTRARHMGSNGNDRSRLVYTMLILSYGFPFIQGAPPLWIFASSPSVWMIREQSLTTFLNIHNNISDDIKLYLMILIPIWIQYSIVIDRLISVQKRQSYKYYQLI